MPAVDESARIANPDFTFSGERIGAIHTLKAETESAKDWLKNHIAEQDRSADDTRVWMEHRYSDAVIQGIWDSGLAIATDNLNPVYSCE